VRDFHSAQVIPTGDYGSVAFPLITRDDLIDITGNAVQTLEPFDAGWRLGMVQSTGEKILSESLTVDNIVFFNSFAPINSVQSCLPGAGLNRFYRISILDGRALTNMDNSVDPEDLTPTDRFAEGSIGAPVSGPGFGPAGPGCSGLDCFNNDSAIKEANESQGLTQGYANPTYWYPVEAP